MVKKSKFPNAPSTPKQFKETLKELANVWESILNQSDFKFDEKTKEHWKKLIDDWAEDNNMPLLIRNSRDGRGRSIKHINNRTLILCDNAPPKWVAERILLKEKHSLKDIRNLFEKNKFPTALALKKKKKGA